MLHYCFVQFTRDSHGSVLSLLTSPPFCRGFSEVQRALSAGLGAAVRPLHVPHLGGVWDFHTHHGPQWHRDPPWGGAGFPGHPGNNLPLLLFCEYSHVFYCAKVSDSFWTTDKGTDSCMCSIWLAIQCRRCLRTSVDFFPPLPVT